MARESEKQRLIRQIAADGWPTDQVEFLKKRTTEQLRNIIEHFKTHEIIANLCLRREV